MPDATLPEGLAGHCDERFVPLAELFATQLAGGAHHGSSVAAYFEGDLVVDVWGGRRRPTRRSDGPSDGPDEAWGPDTMAVSFSTTKGVAATALHMAMERHEVDYDTPIATLWPEFGAHGKEAITIRHALCHESAIPQIRDHVADVADMADFDAMVHMVEGLEPLWEPGTANGYHAVNFGWIVGELVRRIDGRRVDVFVAEEIAAPLGLDGCFIGAPVDEHHRVAPLLGEGEGDPDALVNLLGADSLIIRALSPPGDMGAFLNSPAGLSCVGPAFSGTFTARSLARLYACLERGGTLDGVTLLKPETIATATVQQNHRPDLVLFFPIHWRLGYMSGGSQRSPIGPNREAFGHTGAGGSFGMADPACGLSLAMTCDRMEPDIIGSERTQILAHTAVLAAQAAR